MKIRKGFVSNSSSSSFVCEACGGAYEGWDGEYSGGIRELQCMHGHVFCSNCVDLPDGENEYRYEFNTEYCPICSFNILTDFDGLRYLRYKSKQSKEDILEEIKEQFDTYKDFAKCMKEANQG